MKEIQTLIIVAVSTIIVGFAAWFFIVPAPVKLPVRAPGMDNRPEGGADKQGRELVFNFNTFISPIIHNPVATPIAAEKTDLDLQDNWPYFRGPNRDANWHNENYQIIQDWQTNPLECIWITSVGEGYAGTCIYKGIVYMLDYDAENLSDVLRAIDFHSGQDIWNLSYPVKVKRDHGMSRSIPAVSEKYIVTIGPRCHVMCVDRITGEKLWHVDMVAEYGTKVPLWHASQCPLIIDNTVIIAPAGTDLMVAIDCSTGKVIWETENTDKWDMTHSSIMPIEYDGIMMYVYCGDGGICGVDANTGKKLWVNDEWSMRTNVPTPVYIGNGKLFLCAGYNKGCALLEIYRTLNAESSNLTTNNLNDNLISDKNTTENHFFSSRMVYMKPASVFGAVQHTPVIHNNYIYGIRQDKRLVCLDYDGIIQWESPKNDKYGDSPFMIVNDQLIALDDHGTLSLIELSPKAYNLITRQQILFGRESWGLMAVSNGYLIARDFTELRCYKLAEPKTGIQ